MAHQAIIHSFKAPYRRSKNSWFHQEMILLDPDLKITRLTMFKGILVGWKKTKNKLHFDVNNMVLLEQFMIVKLVKLLKDQQNWSKEEVRTLLSLLASKHIWVLSDLRMTRNRWRTSNSILPRTKNTRNIGSQILNQLLESVSRIG